MPGSPDFEKKAVSRVALLGLDYRGVSFEQLCAQGDMVAAGAVLLRDARRPEIKIVAPAGGRIVDIERGARRKLVALKIRLEPDAGMFEHKPPGEADADSLRAFMLESGAWTSLRTRPFGNIPHPRAQPAAIVVTALDNEAGAPEPGPLIDFYADEFELALEGLAKVADAPLYLCHAPGHSPAAATAANIHPVAFRGGAAVGMPGWQIHKLCPIGFAGGEVWHLGYQDVIALGHLLAHGRIWSQRLVSIGGSAVCKPRNLLVNAGAAIDELISDEVGQQPLQIFAGSAVYGLRLASPRTFLAAGQRQITVDIAGDEDSAAPPPNATAVIPQDRLDQLAPPGIHAVPLMRALQLGDVERARDLGALELVEEDVAPLSHACLSHDDYGRLLRNVLDQLEAGR